MDGPAGNPQGGAAPVARAEASSAERREPVPVLHPNLPALYPRRVETLEEAPRDEATAAAAAEALRVLVEEIRLVPAEGRLRVEVRGALGAILQLAEGARGGGDGAALARQVKVVAGTCKHLDLLLKV